MAGTYGITTLKQDKINNPNSPVTSSDSKTIIKSLSTESRTELTQFSSLSKFKEDLITVINATNFFHKSRIILVPKLDTDITQKGQLQTNSSDEHKYKILKKTLTNLIEENFKIIHTT